MSYLESLKKELQYVETWAKDRVDEVKAEIEKVEKAVGIDKTKADESSQDTQSQNAQKAQDTVGAQASGQVAQAEPVLETATSRVATETAVDPKTVAKK